MWHNYKYSLLRIDMRTKVVQHVQRINISISHITCDNWKAKCDMWHNYKNSLLSLHMKTKDVQHVPRINISIWHMTCAMRHVTCDNYKYSLLSLHMKTKFVQNIQTFRHSWFPAFVWHSDIFIFLILHLNCNFEFFNLQSANDRAIESIRWHI